MSWTFFIFFSVFLGLWVIADDVSPIFNKLTTYLLKSELYTVQVT